MGWSSAGEIFDRVAEVALRNCYSVPCACTPILEELIAALQEGDWDTEGESLERFRDNPVVVEAFARRGIEIDE